MRLEPGKRLLDVGCGTGTLALQVKEEHPKVDVIGLDPDSEILAIARRKAQRSGADIRFDLGYADRLPSEDSSFERVVSSLVFHHLPHETKILPYAKSGGFSDPAENCTSPTSDSLKAFRCASR